MKKIYFCSENEFSTKNVYKRLKLSYPNMKIKRKGCLGKCKMCKQCPFSMLDGEVIKSKTSDKLYHKINKIILKESV